MLINSKNSITVFLRQHWIKLSIASISIAAYALLGFFWVPRLIRDNAINYVETQLHRHLTLGEVTFNPFTLTARIHAIKLMEADKSSIANINDLLVDVEMSSLWHRAYVFKQVRIDTPSITALIDSNGNLNLAAIKPASTTKTQSSAPLPRIHIDRFELLKGELKFADHSRSKLFDVELKPITFTLQNFRTEGEHENAFHFTALSDEHESLDWRGDFMVQPFSANGAMKIVGLKASTIQSYLQDKLPFILGSGTLDIEGKYQVTTNNQFDISLALANIHVSDVHVQPKNASEQKDWLALPQVNVADTAISLHERAINIKRIDVDDANIQAWLDEHRKLNLLQLLNNQNDDKSHGDSNSTTPWNTLIGAINLNRATVHAEDHSIIPAAQFTLSSAQVQLQNFNTAPTSKMDVNVQLNIGSGQLSAQGAVQLDTSNTTLQIHLNGFPLPSLQNYIAQTTDIILYSGTLNSDGNFIYKGNAATQSPLIQYTGTAEVNNFSTHDKAAGGDFIKWKQLQLQSLRYAMAPDQLNIDKIVARGLYGRMAINADTTTNVQHALRLPTNKNESTSRSDVTLETKAVTPAIKIQIAKVIVENGAADFSDDSIQPSFSAGIENLNGEITGLSTNNTSRASVKLEGSVDNYAPVSINGDVNFLAASAFSDLSMEFRNIDLTSFNPYSGKFAGYNIEKGKLATTLHYSIVDRKLDAQHHIVVDQLEFGKATDSKDAVSLPVKLAVALLKDRNGIIELDLPVSGSLDDPEFHAGSIIWRALKNLLIKVVSSPFSALGSLFGGNSDELAFVEFAPGSALLSEVEKDKLNKLSHALVERPQLKLDIPGTTVVDADIQALSKMAFDTALAKYLSNTSSATPQQRLEALTSLYKEKTGKLPEFSAVADKKADVTAERITAIQKQLLAIFTISNDDRDNLADQRAGAVEAQLLSNSELSADRLYKVTTDHSIKSSLEVVRMELKLE